MKVIGISLVLFIVGMWASVSSCSLVNRTTTTTTTSTLFVANPNLILNGNFEQLNSGVRPSRTVSPLLAFQNWADWNVTMPVVPTDGTNSDIFDVSEVLCGGDMGHGNNHAVVAFTSVGTMAVSVAQAQIPAPAAGSYLLDFWMVFATGTFNTQVTLAPSSSGGATLALPAGSTASLNGGTITYSFATDHSGLTQTETSNSWVAANWQHIQIPVNVSASGTVDLQIYTTLGPCSPTTSDEFFRLDSVQFGSGYVP